ncbi:MAG: cation transporter [Kiloniellales bacterium]
MASSANIGPNARAREKAIRFAIIVDSVMLTALVLTALASGSLTILAELVRGSLMFTLELIAYLTMCRVHRGRFHAFDYGSGKVEQVANIGIAGGMLIGGVWIVLSALSNAVSGGEFLSSFGLALAAVFAAVNLYVNALAWYEVSKAARLERSVILEAQLRARWAKALTSVVVFVVLTLAVLARDRLVVTWLDVIGALVVAYYMISVSLDMLRESLIDVLDRSLDEEAQLKIIQALVDVADDYDHYDALRTRRAGNQVFIDVALGFDDALALGEVDKRRRRIEERLKDCVSGADVVVRVAGLRG